MYSEQLTSQIARFLATQTGHMEQVRDNLPIRNWICSDESKK